MALQKEVDTPYGDKANYHRINMVSLDLDGKSLTISTVKYISQETRAAGKAAFSGDSVVLADDKFPADIKDKILAMLYPVLMQQEAFKDAESV